MEGLALGEGETRAEGLERKGASLQYDEPKPHLY